MCTGQGFRARDGFWVGDNGWRRDHVSGVLWINQLQPESVSFRVPVLWLHPNEQKITELPTIWERAIMQDDNIQHAIASIRPNELFGLTSPWPQGEAFPRNH